MEERLQNVLSQRGVASRRHAADMIAAGQVTVNGAQIREPGYRVDPALARIAVRGKMLPKETERLRTIMYYKPRGILSAVEDERGKTVCDLLRGAIQERVVPVGRLDKDSEGLMLLSNDGALTLKLTHPRFAHEKVYHVRVAGRMTDEKIRILQSPLTLDDGYTIRPVEVEVVRVGEDNTHDLVFHLLEGRKRQIRKMCSIAHFTVLDLKRVSIGALKLDPKLSPGCWRDLTPAELASLTH